jgi:hypothetical protein
MSVGFQGYSDDDGESGAELIIGGCRVYEDVLRAMNEDLGEDDVDGLELEAKRKAQQGQDMPKKVHTQTGRL